MFQHLLRFSLSLRQRTNVFHNCSIRLALVGGLELGHRYAGKQVEKLEELKDLVGL